ncbi:MAG: hypothetical protein ABSC06_09430 [Rhodopila sp.]|jgi:hypothetical protein
MDLTEFRASTEDVAPPASLSLPLQALWWDATGDWDKAHECAQADPGATGAAVHAYLHRKEPDLSNARYWYNRAGRTPATGPLDQEWNALVAELLGV